MEAIAGPDNVMLDGAWHTGCTDMGDISCVMPAIHPFVRGATGIAHGENYVVSDPETACVLAAKALLATAVRLLGEDAKAAKEVISNASPLFPSQQSFLQAIDQLALCQKAVIYHDDGSVTLDYVKHEEKP